MSDSHQIIANRVDVLRQQIAPVAMDVRNGRIADIRPVPEADVFVVPGFVDAHVHIESSMLLPSEFARVAVRHGTVATVSDPHEIANVCGVEGIELMLEDAAASPLKFHFGAPSCVPATSFETSGAVLDVKAVEQLLDDPRINHLSEMMNFPGVLAGDLDVMSKIIAARSRGLPVDGHAPGLRGSQAERYFAAGISTDHECVTLDEALEKIRYGAKIAIREGSAARNFDTLWPLLNEHAEDCLFCSDDKHPDDLLLGHINLLVCRAVERGVDVMDALQAACITPVQHYQLPVGLLQIGDPADFIVLENLHQFEPIATYIDGCKVAERGESYVERVSTSALNQFVAEPVRREAIHVVGGVHGERSEHRTTSDAKLRVIEVVDGQIVTGAACVAVSEAAALDSRVAEDVLKLVVVNRYQCIEPAVGFVRGFGLKAGALASSVAHDSHNIVAVGENDDDLIDAINLVIAARGGLALNCGEESLVLPLPVAGLMSLDTCDRVATDYGTLDSWAKSLGCRLESPFMTLSFLALPVIPKLKLTDKGLFDVERFEFVSLFCDD